MKQKYKDILIRALKTFGQAFLSVFSIEQLLSVTDLSTAKALLYSMLIGGVAAGVSAVWNMAINLLSEGVDAE